MGDVQQTHQDRLSIAPRPGATPLGLALADLLAAFHALEVLIQGRVFMAQRAGPLGVLDELLRVLGPEVAPREVGLGLDEAHYQIGYVQHMLKKDPSGALPSYEKAVEAVPDNLEYRTQLGVVLSELEQYDRAIEQLEQVVASPAYALADAWLYLGAAQREFTGETTRSFRGPASKLQSG